MHFEQWAYLIGLVAGILYIVTVVVGGKLWSGYSIYQAISELTLRTSPHWMAVSACFVVFNLLMLVHGAVLVTNFTTNSWLQFSGIVYVIVAFAGLVMVRYPMDHKTQPQTRPGKIHRTMATVAIIGSVVIVISSAIGFSQIVALRSLTMFSALASLIIFTTSFGIWMSALRKSPAFGSFQKASLGTFMIWLCYTSVEMHYLLS